MRCFKDLWTALIVTVATSVALVMAMGPAYADDNPDRLLRVPVFFITDRNLQHSKDGAVNFGGRRKYIEDCLHDPYMGSAYYVIANAEGKQLTDHLKDLGWSKAEAHDKVGDFAATLITAPDFEKIEEQFYKQVHEKALLTEDKNLFVFAHGFKNSFHGALGPAAKLAYNSERPLILYSWPSLNEVRAYSTDENNVEWSQEHFNVVLNHLERMSLDDPSTKVRLFAHSMGTRLVVRATPLLREKPYVVEASLICPDVDDGLVKHYAKTYLSVKGTAMIRLYMSRHDKALPLSQLLHGGYNRLGEQADALGGWVGKIITAPASAFGQAEKPDTSAEDAEYAKRLELTKARMQTIDFTSIDTGLIGHNIPAKLICSMSFTGTPGAGLSFVSEKSGERSKLSHMFSNWAKLRGNDAGSPVISGTVLRVVRDDIGKHGASKLADQPAH